eukprot:CAMPEP_0118855222 /NCGR_PEP_ID=MMETSP1163-20130328/3133_1 /TAXON_ID=124430 /ORGANISM="Phaeomonas parva, Strain CCMP2877" /LENGTH=332 /DNA_ID=CAMNT_0006788075 /DNA_START=59 /DNA_END=1057 /DNA_ORIENTATION=-
MMYKSLLLAAAAAGASALRMAPRSRLSTALRAATAENPDTKWAPLSRPESEYLIAEELVTNDEEASALADRCIDEAIRLFDAPSEEGWTNVFSEDGINVESKPLHGPYEDSGVLIVRGVGTVPASADKFYDWQVSREGFQSIDEYLVNHRMVEQYKWKSAEKNGYTEDDYDLMMNRVEWKYPIKRREFVALDTTDRKRKILISKSALHKDRPGGSKYQDEIPLDEKEFVRAVQYYASRVTPIDDENCQLEMVTWGEMCDSYSAYWVNLFNAHVFITPKFQRFREAMSGKKVWEESKIVDNAWRIIKLLPSIKPDLGLFSMKSDFVRGKMKVD